MNLLINYNNVVSNLVPYFLRKPNLIKFIYSTIKPLIKLHNNPIIVVMNFGQSNKSFYQWYLFIKNHLRFNSQIIYLEKYLNSVYYSATIEPDFVVGQTWQDLYKIWILDIASTKNNYVFNVIEAKPEKYLYNNTETQSTYFFNNSEFNGTDFIVRVPSTLSFDLTLMTSRINQYKLASKTFIITTY